MAEFNVTPNPQQPGSYTGLSEGIRSSADTGVGTLFEGLARTLDMGVKEQDRNIKANIEEDIFAEVDSVQGEFGIPEATDLQRDAEEQSIETSPMGVRNAKSQLERLQSAYAAGGLKESHYWARMNSMVRQLRGKYPGYRAEIDQMVAGVTGARPANALRSALMREWEAASQEAGGMDRFIEKVAGETGLPSDFYARMDAGNPYSKNELMHYYSSRNKDKWDRDERRSAMSEAKDRDALQEQDVVRNFQTEVNRIANTVLKDASSAAGKDWSTLQTAISEAQQAAASGKPINATDGQELQALLAQVKSSVMTAMNAATLEAWNEDPTKSYSVELSSEQINDAISEAMKPIELMEQALINENWGLVGAQAAWIDAQKTEASARLLDGMPHAETLAAARDVLGPEIFNQMLTLNPKLQNSVDKALLDYWSAASVLNNGHTIADQFEQGEAKGREPEYFEAAVNEWTSVVDAAANGVLTMDVLKAKVPYMFGPGSDRVMSQLDTDSRHEYFKKVASPMVSKAMLQLKQQGEDELYQQYEWWVANSFQVLFKDKVATLQELVLDPNHFDVEWDPRNSRFKVDLRLTANTSIRHPLTPNINQLNDAIRVIAPIIGEGGGDMGTEVLNLMMAMGFDPNAEPGPSAVGSVINRMINSLRQKIATGQKNMAAGRAGAEAGSMVEDDTSPWEPTIEFGPIRMGGRASDYDEYRRRREQRQRQSENQ